MKIGILGGTFDPIHVAHLELGRSAKQIFGLDRILVMPSGNSYFKTVTSHVTDAYYRAEMVKLAIAEEDGMEFSDIEIRRNGYTYTSDTLLTLSRCYPEAELYFIIGADSLHGMRHWYAPEVMFRHASIIVADRNHQISREQKLADQAYLAERYGARIYFMDFVSMKVSSSQVREDISKGMLPHGLLTDSVSQYIRQHHLYQSPMTEEEILEDLKHRLKPSRFEHTLGVAETAEAMARAYGTVDPDQARLAGILHDCGKNEGTALTHGPVGARIAREEYGICDEEILGAITWHTTGKPAMTDLEKIIFIADYIEPGRDKAPNLEALRKLAYVNLDKTMICILNDTLSYLRNAGIAIDERSLTTYNYYTNLV